MYGKGKVELLSVKTLDAYLVDVSKLCVGSHQKVFVRCLRCGDEFLREFRYLHQLHNCPTRKVIDGLDCKWCNKCNSFRPVSICFSHNQARYDNLAVFCNDCLKLSPSAIKHRVNCAIDRTKTLDGWLKWSILHKKATCKRYGIPINIDVNYLKAQWQSQEGRCYYCGVKLCFGKKSIRSAWMERLDSTKGYVEGNVVWSSKAMNCAKNDANYDDWIDFLLEAEFTRRCPVRLECRLLHDDAKMPFRKRITDAGYDISTIEPGIVEPYKSKSFKTGIALTTPPGWYYTIEGRSGMWKWNIHPHTGIVDSTYNGELVISLSNSSGEPYKVSVGDRIAQIIVHKSHNFDLTVVDEFGAEYISDRGEKGFGSSGA